ncbi:hypothetical protein AVEN_99966-1 [Araneus ventricosus]|uniref:Uncharacterized protein n=1 Tax=Araneus ventricosus TaxID=182803 RepID=A0A4Y2A7K9_ARAVE|nr:hypothetical protein AVEN_99966-1 [Araneus ventricosus]
MILYNIVQCLCATWVWQGIERKPLSVVGGISVRRGGSRREVSVRAAPAESMCAGSDASSVAALGGSMNRPLHARIPGPLDTGALWTRGAPETT